jgi:hypothetical protein
MRAFWAVMQMWSSGFPRLNQSFKSHNKYHSPMFSFKFSWLAFSLLQLMLLELYYWIVFPDYFRQSLSLQVEIWSSKEIWISSNKIRFFPGNFYQGQIVLFLLGWVSWGNKTNSSFSSIILASSFLSCYHCNIAYFLNKYKIQRGIWE